MARFAKFEIYDMVVAPLTLLLLLATFILWVLSLFKCQTLRDPARSGFVWLKVALALHCLHLLLDVVGLTLEVVFLEVYSGGALNDTLLYLSPFAKLFRHGVLISLFIALASTGVGILLLRDPSPLRHHAFFTVAIRCTAGLMAILTVTFFGLSLDYTRSIAGDRRFQSRPRTNLLRVRQLGNVIDIFWFVICVAILGFAAFLRVKVAKTHSQLQKACQTLLACSILWFVQSLFSIIWIGLYYSFTDFRSVSDEPDEIIILKFIFNDLDFFAIFALLFLLGKRKMNGLWSGPQSYSTTQNPSNYTNQAVPQHGQYGQYNQPQYGPVQSTPGFAYGNGQQPYANTTWQQPTAYPQMPQQALYPQGQPQMQALTMPHVVNGQQQQKIS